MRNELESVTAHIVFSHFRRLRILERAHRVEHRVRYFLRIGSATEQRVQRGRLRNRSVRGAQGRGQFRKRRLIIIDEDRAVLQQSSILAPLGATNEFCAAGHQLSFTRNLKTGTHARNFGALCTPGGLHVDAKRAQAELQDPIDAVVRLAERAGADWCGDAIGDFAVVENRAATSWAAYDVDLRLPNLFQVVKSDGRLIAAE